MEAMAIGDDENVALVPSFQFFESLAAKSNRKQCPTTTPTDKHTSQAGKSKHDLGPNPARQPRLLRLLAV